MAFKLQSIALARPRQIPNLMSPSPPLTFSNHSLSPLHFFAPSLSPNLCLSTSTFHRSRFVTARVARDQELIETSTEDEVQISEVFEEENRDEETVRKGEKKELAKQSIWSQMKEIVMFTGPATGIWICGPLMSLIDTAVIGQGSSTELAALGSRRRRTGIVTARLVTGHELSDESEDKKAQINKGYEVEKYKEMELAEQSVWNQMKEIVMFTGPAIGLWLCDPLMSLIDTAVVGRGSSIELAALGPATVVCDYMTFTFMFLSVVTSNMVATALAKQDREEVQHHISVLLFVGLACGFLMLLFTRLFGAAILTAFTGSKNLHVVPAANSYVQIRGLAWPALLVGWVAQSASLGMKDSWGPLKALVVASVINGIGDMLLCSYLGYGIAGAAWATMASQVVSACMMIQTLNKKGYNAFAFSIPSGKEFLTIFGLAAPVYVTSISKVAFFSLLIYVATSMGTQTMAAHQVMVQIYMACTVWGEPLCQTAQSFMPELMYGVNRSLAKARSLLRSLVIIGAVLGLLLGTVGTSVLWLFPYIFTPDQIVIHEMHRTVIPFFIALAVTPPTRSLEGTLLAGQDLRFISLSTCGCFCLGAMVLLILSRYGFQGCWISLAGFQWARFSVALLRLLSPNGILYSEDLVHYKPKVEDCLV